MIDVRDHANTLLSAADAAVTWWRAKKPKGWGVEKHLANPLVNCTTYREKLLARRASRWFAVCRGHQGKRGSPDEQ